MEPTIVGSQTPIWLEYLQGFGPFIAVGLTALITWKIVLRRIEAEFNIKREETRLFKERVFIEKKIALLNDVEALIESINTDAATHIKLIRAKLLSVRDRVASYVIKEKLIDIAQRGVDECTKLGVQMDKTIINAKNKKKGEIDSSLEITESKLEKPFSALRMAILLLHEHLSFDLGFKPKKASGNAEDIDSFAEDLIKRTKSNENEL